MRHPKRLEIGVVPDTVAGMQPAGSKKPQEIWVMWADIGKNKFGPKKKIIISAWRYPGVSPIHEPPPIPDDVWEIIRREKKKAR